ncbi:MAG: site-specific integrase [Pseudolabrys sp.]|nr:site-specific integrase [Pseudolabrys sp.]
MPVAHLTDIVVQRLRTPGTYFDKTTPAFGIRVGKNRKTWIVMRGKDRVRTRVGHYPSLSLSDARTAAKKLLVEPVTKATRITVRAANETFKLEHCSKKKARTRYDYERVMDKYIVPELGSKKLADVTYEGVLAITKDMADTPSEQSHVLAVARTFFRWCVQPPRRYLMHSPLEGLRVDLGKGRKRVLLPAELKKVWDGARKQGYPHGTIVRLLILTGQRRGEIANLRRAWVNEKERTITLPDWVTKNGRQHTIPFGAMVAEIIETVPRLNTTDLLFPSRDADDRPVSGFSKFKKELDEQYAGVGPYVLHDLRRTFGTKLAELKVLPHVVERMLNHTMGSIGNRADSIVSAVAEVYNLATYLPEMRQAIDDKWEPYLRNLLQRP